MNKPTAVTLFSGLGSSSLALRDLGYHVLPHDFMPEAVATLQSNGFRDARHVDVRDIDYSEYPETEVLVGGPPCQPFSQAHAGDGQYDERDMIPEFLRAVAELTPKLFVMEEVQTLTWKRHAEYLSKVLDDARAIGYRVEARVLNAADFGIPQARKRLFMVGVREDVAQGRDEWRKFASALWPESWDKVDGWDPIYWPNAEEYTPMTMAEALGWTTDDCFRRNQAVPDERARIDPNHYDDTRHLWPMGRASTTVVGSFRPEVQAAPGYRKAGDGPRQSTKGSVVTTLEERLILQDMPTYWVVQGSKAKQDLQVGNSVPRGLIRDLLELNIP